MHFWTFSLIHRQLQRKVAGLAFVPALGLLSTSEPVSPCGQGDGPSRTVLKEGDYGLRTGTCGSQRIFKAPFEQGSHRCLAANTVMLLQRWEHFISFKILFIYLFERERGAEGEGQAHSVLSMEPDMGFDPRTLRL